MEFPTNFAPRLLNSPKKTPGKMASEWHMILTSEKNQPLFRPMEIIDDLGSESKITFIYIPLSTQNIPKLLSTGFCGCSLSPYVKTSSTLCAMVTTLVSLHSAG